MNTTSTTSPKRGHGESSSELGVADMARYLSRLASLEQDDLTGNAELSRSLKSLSRALKPYSGLSMSELTKLIKNGKQPVATKRTSATRVNPNLPEGVESLSLDEVEDFLGDEKHTKGLLVELGFRRFGISRSKLERLPKAEALESVYAALEHEKSLEAISREARGTKSKRGFSAVQRRGASKLREAKAASKYDPHNRLVVGVDHALDH